MSILGVEEHHIYGLPDGALADHEQAGLVGRPAARCRPTRHRPDLRARRDHVPSRSHRRPPLGHAGLGGSWLRARLLYAAPSTEHLAEFGEIYEKWDMYMSDERPVGVPADQLAVHAAQRVGARQEALRLAGAGHPDVRAHRHARCRGLCLAGCGGVLRRRTDLRARLHSVVGVSRVGNAGGNAWSSSSARPAPRDPRCVADAKVEGSTSSSP